METATDDNKPQANETELLAIGAFSAEQLAEVVFSYGSMFQQLGDTASRLASQSLDTAVIGKKIFQNIESSFEAFNVFYDSLPRVSLNLDALAKAFSKAARGIEIAPSVIEHLSEYFDFAFENLEISYPKADWRALRNGHKTWGKYGWVIYDSFPYSYVSNPPESLQEANALAMQVMHKEQIEGMFEELQTSIPKTRDIREAIELYRKRHYKPCAMMIFSLIDCELYKEDWCLHGRKGKGDPSRPLNAMRQTDNVSSIFALTAEGAFHAHHSFYKGGGGGFVRENEGELNRNFLMHGMTYDPVTKRSCVKLFALLNCICRLKMESRSK